MTQTVPGYRFSVDEFVRAWEAGVFEHRVEMVDGEVWPVIIGTWHGRTTMSVGALLRHPDVEVTNSTLPASASVPDPDCWVMRAGASPSGTVGTRLDVWAADDVLLVVEVSDETVMADLTTKARLYGSAGFGVYWVITPDVVYEHTEPTEGGYRLRREYRTGDVVPVRHSGAGIPVDQLLGP